MLVALELTTASVGQIILFSDGIKTLLGGQSDAIWKVICGAAFIPLSCAPLRYLRVSSALSVFCFLIISTVMLTLGRTRPSDPGSPHTPAQISILPSNFFSMVGCSGMPLAAWGGHTVFPELYHDMRKPEQFFDSVKASYAVTFPLYLVVGILGYLMFGNKIEGPITSEILSLKHSPCIVSITLIVTVTFFPIAKIPLKWVLPTYASCAYANMLPQSIRPLSSAINRSYDLHTMGPEAKELDSALMRSFRHPIRTPAIRALIGALFVALAIMFPNLDDVMSVLGVVAGLLIAVTLPVCFYLSILGDEVSSSQRYLCVFILAFSSILAVGSLVCTFAGFS